MNVKKLILISLLPILLLFSSTASAYRQGYERKTDEIYATVRNDMPVYSDEYSTEPSGTILRFSAICVIFNGESWYEVEYDTKDYGTQIGWVTKEDFRANCLVYDAREKQLIADGDYLLSYKDTSRRFVPGKMNYHVNMNESSFSIHLTHIEEDYYQISKKDTSLYLQSLSTGKNTNFWGPEETSGTFQIRLQGSYFTIQDSSNQKYLIRNDLGIICYGKTPDPSWQLTRYQAANTKDSLRNYVQYDAQWCSHYYGPGKNDDPNHNLFCTSGCGIFATVNAIYAATGIFPDPYELGDFAVEKNYRILGAGTDHRIFKGAAKRYGARYGFSYDGSTGSTEKMIQKLEEGDIVIVHIPSHYITIVDYDLKKKKFLILDPHYLPKRGTNPYGDWIPRKALDGESQDGNLEASEYFFYKPNRPSDQP